MSDQPDHFQLNIYTVANPALHRVIIAKGLSDAHFLINLQLYWLAPREIPIPGLRIDESEVHKLVNLALQHYTKNPEEKKALRQILEIGVKEFHPGAIL
jgi:hypothetical protein